MKMSGCSFLNQNPANAKIAASLMTPTNQATPTKLSVPPNWSIYNPIKLSFARWVMVINNIKTKNTTYVLLRINYLTSKKSMVSESTFSSGSFKVTKSAIKPKHNKGQIIYCTPTCVKMAPIIKKKNENPIDDQV